MPYEAFAEFYDGLTRNVDYKEKADFICDILRRYSHEPGTTLDLACGTGTLTLELKRRGIDIFGADMSYEMLTQAQMKAAEEELDVMFVRQKMQSLELWGEIDTCVCTLDSLNHLQGKKELEKALKRISHYMTKGGLFVFDMNTPYKHECVLGDNTFVYDTDEVFLVWRNTFREKDCSVEIELDFFIPEDDVYYRESECFREFAYSLDQVKEMLSAAGFEVLGVFDDTSFSEPNEKSQRITVAAKKV